MCVAVSESALLLQSNGDQSSTGNGSNSLTCQLTQKHKEHLQKTGFKLLLPGQCFTAFSALWLLKIRQHTDSQRSVLNI